ncbi:MAG: hypothetical protein R3277_12120 [Brumimicrobium sp.]|nr:hypothetical protein [Brumimicrobium sp.]
MTWIKTLPGEPDYVYFERLPYTIYPKESPRFKLGFDPVNLYLTGCFVYLENNEPKARFAFYENPLLRYNNRKVACIGSYECVKNTEIAERTLEFAKEIARSKDYGFLIGPMEGATWNNYRFTDDFKEGPFFMEPYHHPYYPEQFRASGFNIIAKYASNLDNKLFYDQKEIDEKKEEFLNAGLRIRNIDLTNFREELNKMACFCNAAFKDNFLFTPIKADVFLDKYLKFKDKIDPEFFLIVENRDQEIVGLFFPVKDFNDHSEQRFILKTMARTKDFPVPGMVRFLGQKTIKTALKKGFREVIHAFILQENVSVEISNRFMGKPYKSHSLYGTEL